MVKSGFDIGNFHGALDAQRSAKGLTWKDVAEQSGVSASTLTRMSQGKRPDVDGLALLLAWSGLDVSQFTPPAKENPEPLAQITAKLRTDQNLTKENAEALESIIKVAYQKLKKR